MEAVKDKLTLIELDKSLAQHWTSEGYRTFHTDALKFDWSGVPEGSILISNLPYQISSRLLIELFVKDHGLGTMVLMFQKEVGERIRALPEDKKTYGLLSILCDLFWDVKPLVKVPGQCFFPQPEVESLVLTFEKKAFPDAVDKRDFVKHLKMLFASRRKKMGSSFKNLKNNMNQNLSQSLYQSLFNTMELRPDSLSPKEHLDFYLKIKEMES